MKKIIEEKRAFIFILLLFLLFSFYKTRGKEELILIDQDILLDQSLEEEEVLEEKMIFVHVAGNVKRPGLFQVEEESRLDQLIDLAGIEDLDLLNKYFNRAEILEDGMKIYIPFPQEIMEEEFSLSFLPSDSKQDKKININKASREDLMSLPGIGQVKAQDIVNYREKNGDFKAIDDIMRVKGIGQATFENLKDLIKT